MNNFEQVWEWALGPGFSHFGEERRDILMLGRGIEHGDPSLLWTDRHDWKHYIPANYVCER